MNYEILGWPGDGVVLDLDHREFAYAGKFVMSGTGKAVAREGDAASEKANAARENANAARENANAASENADVASDTGDGTADGRADPVAAIAFDDDRTDPATTWLRYVTVRADRRGEGVGPRLVRYVTDRVRERSAETVRIGVNNPFAYEALYRAGFGFTGEETGLAELVLEQPGDRSARRYRDGLDRFRDREDLPDAARAFLDDRTNADPPEVVPVPE